MHAQFNSIWAKQDLFLLAAVLLLTRCTQLQEDLLSAGSEAKRAAAR